MAESFKYTRLEVSSLLYKSWEEYKTLLLRKSYSVKNYSLAFYPYPSFSLYKKQQKLKKGSGCFSINLGGFYNYTNNKYYWKIWNYKGVTNDKYTHSINIKKNFLKEINKVNSSFYGSNSFNTMFEEKEQKNPFKNLNFMIYTMPMISLSAAILEGGLREILAKYLQEEINKYVELGNIEGRKSHNNYQKILVAKQSFIESHSSISNLLTEYSILFNLKTKTIIHSDVIKIIKSLSTLRNFVAHGTSIVTTNKEVQEDEYFRSWNVKIKELQLILKKYFGSDNVYLNLSDCRLPDFYMMAVRIYLLKIISYIQNHDDSSKKAVESTKIVNIMKDFKSSYIKDDEVFLSWFD